MTNLKMIGFEHNGPSQSSIVGSERRVKVWWGDLCRGGVGDGTRGDGYWRRDVGGAGLTWLLPDQ